MEQVDDQCRVPQGFPRFMELPADIRCKILSKLPVKSIGQFMCVSKIFQGLKKDSSFLKMCLTSRPCSFIVVNRYQGCSKTERLCVITKTDDGKQGCETIEFSGQDERYRTFGSCNGLLCVFSVSSYYDNPLFSFCGCDFEGEKICIHNPVTDEDMYLPEMKISAHGSSGLFGFDTRSETYKVVVCNRAGDLDDKGIYIITLGDNSWRRLSAPSECEFTHRRIENSVLFNGAFYWVTKKETDSHSENLILSIDIHSEKFSKIEFIDPSCQNTNVASTRYYLVRFGKSLALCELDVSDKQKLMKVWILEDAEKGIWRYESTHELSAFLQYKEAPEEYKLEEPRKKDPESYRCRVRGVVCEDTLIIEYGYCDVDVGEDAEVEADYFSERGHVVCYTPESRKFSADLSEHEEFPKGFYEAFSFVPSLVSPGI